MNSPPQPWLKVIIGLTMMVLLAGGIWFYRGQERLIQHAVEAELQAIARLKIEQIANWRTERLNDSAVIMESPFFNEAVAKWMASPKVENYEKILTRLRSIQEHYSYMDVFLVDAEGHERIILNSRPGSVHANAGRAMAEAFTTCRPVLTDMNPGTGDLPPYLDVIAPIFVSNPDAGSPAGAIILR